MRETKTEWRERLVRSRRAMEPGARRDASAAVVARIATLPEFRRARSVLLYVALGAELDPHALALHAWHAAKEVFLPGGDVPPAKWTLVGPTARAVGAASPVAAAPPLTYPDGATSVEPPAFLVAPGVGFDVHGTRLGRGRGYYDRAIAALRAATTDLVVVGVAFDLQVVAALPHDAWDQPVDLVVTERRVLAPAAGTRHDVQEIADEP